MSMFTRRRQFCTTLAGALLATASGAAADTPTSDSQSSGTYTANYVDLIGSLGYSSSPGFGSGESSAFARVSAYGVHSWTTERGFTSLTGFVENTTYFNHFGSRQLFDLGAHTRQEVSEKVTIYGDLGFTGDFDGQLSNRLPTVPSQPPITEPGNPLPPPSTSPDVFAFTGRNYRLFGDLGATIRTFERGTLSLTLGAQRSWFPGSSNVDNYNTYHGSIGWSTQVSERTSVGATVYLQHQDYSQGGWANVVNPVATVHTQLSESLTADGSIGVLVIEQRSFGSTDHRVSPSFSGSLCSTTTVSGFCVRVQRDANSALSSRIANFGTNATINTTGTVDYYRHLGPYDTIQASLTATHYDSASPSSSSPNGNNFTTTYLSAVLGYDHRIGHRLAIGVSGGARKLYQTGPDPKLDLNANVYLRYRLGDVQ